MDRTHRRENLTNVSEIARTIIIKLVRYNDRKKIFDSKKTYAMKRKMQSQNV